MSTTADALPATGGWSASLWVRRRAAVNGSALFAGDSPDSAESVSVKLETWKAENPDYRAGLSSRHRWDEPMGYTAPLNTWAHLVFVGDSSGTRLYADGVLVYTSSRVADLPLRTIGAWFDTDDNPRDQIRADLDDIRIYDEALTAEQVETLHHHYPPQQP